MYVPIYDKSRNRVYQIVKKIMDDCQISDNEESYDIENGIGDKLQNWLDSNIWIKKNFPGKRFQILVFLKTQTRAVYKTTVENWRETIPLNLAFVPNEKDVVLPGHFAPIKHMAVFFKKKCYCNLCENTYDKYERHPIKCPFRCNKCGRGTKERCEVPGTKYVFSKKFFRS